MSELVTADWHIRSTVPGCIDCTQSEWMDFQRKSIERVGEIAVEHRVDGINVGGDLFHSEATASVECIYMIQDFAARMNEKGIKFRIMAGNHDLINHSSSNVPKSAIGVLMNSKHVLKMTGDQDCPIKGCNFDDEDYENSTYMFKHVLTIPKDKIPFGVECETPESLLLKYVHHDVICTGDYHRNFLFVNDDKRLVINSGCLTRQASDFEDYEPGVYVVDLEAREAEFVKIGLEQKFNHNGRERKQLDKAIENFVTGIKKENVTLDYVSSLRNESKNHEKEVQDKVGDWIERSGN